MRKKQKFEQLENKRYFFGKIKSIFILFYTFDEIYKNSGHKTYI